MVKFKNMKMLKFLHLVLCMLIVLVVGAVSVTADGLADFRTCVHLWAALDDLQAARGPASRDLRVGWGHLHPAVPADAFVTVVVGDELHQAPVSARSVLVRVPRARALDIAVALTRSGYLISEIGELHLGATQMRVPPRPPAPDRPSTTTPRPVASASAAKPVVANHPPVLPLPPHTTVPQSKAPAKPKLGPVSNLMVDTESVTDSSLQLTWTPPASLRNLRSYEVEYCRSGYCTAQHCQDNDSRWRDTSGVPYYVNGFTIKSLKRNTEYHLRVRSNPGYRHGASDPSPWVCTTGTTIKSVLPAVVGLKKVGTPTTNSTILTWSAPTDRTALAGFQIQRCTVANCKGVTPTKVLTSKGIIAIVSGLNAGTTYHFRIQAKAKGDSDYLDSPWSSTIDVTTAASSGS